MNHIIGWIATNDTQAFQFINHKLKCKFLDFFLPKITHMGGAAFTISTLLLLIGLAEAPTRSLAIKALLSLTISHIIVHIVKKIYCRERPYKKFTNIIFRAHPLKDYSFPSGHTTAVFSISVIFALHSMLLASILLPITMLIGFSRMYLGLHYPTDCIVGALLGTLCALVVYFFSIL